MKAGMNLQDGFLNTVRREGSEVKILLGNGQTLQGSVKGFDNFTVVVNGRDGQQHLVYKHGIAQITAKRSPRREGEAAETEVTESGGETATVQPAPARKRQSRPEPQPKRDGFNTLDLSKVKIGDKKAEVPSE